MKILFVAQEYGVRPSGVMTVIGELCNEWDKCDHITILVNGACQINENLFLNKKCNGVNVSIKRLSLLLPSDYRVGSFFLKLLIRPLRWINSSIIFIYLIVWIRNNNFDGVLSHNGGWPGGELNRIAIYAAWLIGVPVRILVIHNRPFQYSLLLSKLYYIYNRVVSTMATSVVTVSNECRDALYSIAGFKSVRVIYNGISIDEHSHLMNHRTNHHPPWIKQFLTVGFVGEMSHRKGVHVLADAIKKVNLPFEAVFVGNGDDSYVSEIQSSLSHTIHPVHFLGFRSDMSNIYHHIDILVLPSIMYESFGMVIIEAMRNGIPVICSDFGGMNEVVANYETGFVVSAGNSTLLASAIDRLLSDKPLRLKMGELGRKRVATMFSSEIMAKNYMQFFHVV